MELPIGIIQEVSSACKRNLKISKISGPIKNREWILANSFATVKYKSYAQSVTLYETIKYYALSPTSYEHIHAKIN